MAGQRRFETIQKSSVERSSSGSTPARDSAADSGVPLKNPHAAALGRLGGLKGGRARAISLSPARRRAIARKAALARWRRNR
jgi:hypothetical protein